LVLPKKKQTSWFVFFEGDYLERIVPVSGSEAFLQLLLQVCELPRGQVDVAVCPPMAEPAVGGASDHARG
jgi:hypothetical protein